MSLKRVIKKDITVLIIGKFLQVLLAFLSIRLLTTYLNIEEVGKYYLILTILTLLNFGFLNAIGQYYNRFLIHWKKIGVLKDVSLVLLSVRLILAVFAVGTSLIIYSVLSYESYFLLWEYISLITTSLISGTSLVLLNAVNILGKRLAFVIYTVISSLIGLIISLLLVLCFTKSAFFWIIGIAASQIIVLILVYVKYFHETYSLARVQGILSLLSFKKFKMVLYFCLPVIITLFLQWGQNSSFRLIVGDLYSLESLAKISVGLAISSSIFNAFESLVNQYYIPMYYKDISSSITADRADVHVYYSRKILPIYLLLLIFTVIAAPFLLKILVDAKFHDVSIYVVIGSVIEFLRVSTNVVYLVSQSELRTKETVMPYILGLLTTLLFLLSIDMSLSLWLIPLSLAAGGAVIFFSLYFNMKRVLAIQLPWVECGKVILLSLPFSLMYFIGYDISLIGAVLVVSIFSIYLLVLIYFVNKDSTLT